MGGPVVTRRNKSIDPDAEALAKGTDSLNAKLSRAEAKLATFGVEGSVPIENAEDFTHLAFTKFGNAWRLTLENHRESQMVVALSRDLRITAALKVPELVNTLRQRVRAERARVEAANKALDQFLGGPDVSDDGGDDDIPF